MPARPLLLVVEDDNRLSRTLTISLMARGFDVIEAGSGEEAMTAFDHGSPDLVILDLGLPDMDGLDALAHLRQTSRTPVIVLSARYSQSQKVDALEAGADDFVTKPFGLEELVARIRAALRRGRGPEDPPVVTTAEFALDFDGLVATVGDAEVRLTPTEWKLARALTRRPGSLVSAQDLLAEVWGPSFVAQTHYLRVYVGTSGRSSRRMPAKPPTSSRSPESATGSGSDAATDGARSW